MNKEFIQAIQVLRQNNQSFINREISSVAHSHARQAALSAALRYMAQSFRVTLQLPLIIDSNGDIAINSICPKTKHTTPSEFGPAYTAWLNTAKPRTGTPGTHWATLCPQNSWCFLNHFEAEKMVLAFFDSKFNTNQRPSPSP